MPMGSEILSQPNGFFTQLLDCICFSILAGWDIQRGSLCIIQKTVIFFLLVVLVLFFVVVSICSYLGIKHLVCLANVSEWKLNECLQSFLSLTDHDFSEQEFYDQVVGVEAGVQLCICFT